MRKLVVEQSGDLAGLGPILRGIANQVERGITRGEYADARWHIEEGE